MKGIRSVFAERTGSGYFLDFDWDRDNLAYYGVSLADAQAAVQNAIEENVTTTVEGRERYPVNLGYIRDFSSDMGAIEDVLVQTSGDQKQVSLAQLAAVKTVDGSSMIRNEDGLGN